MRGGRGAGASAGTGVASRAGVRRCAGAGVQVRARGKRARGRRVRGEFLLADIVANRWMLMIADGSKN